MAHRKVPQNVCEADEVKMHVKSLQQLDEDDSSQDKEDGKACKSHVCLYDADVLHSTNTTNTCQQGVGWEITKHEPHSLHSLGSIKVMASSWKQGTLLAKARTPYLNSKTRMKVMTCSMCQNNSQQ